MQKKSVEGMVVDNMCMLHVHRKSTNMTVSSRLRSPEHIKMGSMCGGGSAEGITTVNMSRREVKSYGGRQCLWRSM